ncbi:hypothetical protein ACWD7F_38205 [Streptomyces sp. NPDC005122]
MSSPTRRRFAAGRVTVPPGRGCVNTTKSAAAFDTFFGMVFEAVLR